MTRPTRQSNLLWLFVLFFAVTGTFYAQPTKSYKTVRTEIAPRIDGHLDDSCWFSAPVADNFIQHELQPGNPSAMKSEVRLVYDDDAIYVGAMLYDSSADSVLHELSVRDIVDANADLFGVYFDTYNDDINAFAFGVTAAGTQIDLRISNQGWDMNWNAVWHSSVRIVDNGWIVEFKIPYSALRFSSAPTQTWGFNIQRNIRRLREEGYWNNVDPQIDAFVRQFGDLEGLENIKAPPRLSFSPYIAGIVNNDENGTSYSGSGGMDVKYGVSDAFTLDMTLIPDFSQVQSDNQVLNLSPFEVQYQERRPFFTEGTELFNIGGLFYSRRVGGQPVDYYTAEDAGKVIHNPQQTRLFNATKLSGRTPGKLGIGFFNAVSDETRARVELDDGSISEILTSPYTNYNIVVLDQAMKNNSSVNFVNTNVTRHGAYQNANVTHGGIKLFDKSNTWTANANVTLSSIISGHLLDADNGYRYNLEAGKTGGNMRWLMFGSVKSDRFNINDLGYLPISNNVETGLWLGYHLFKPFWKVNNMYNNVTFMYQRMFNPSAFWNFGIYGNSNTTFTKRFITYGINYGIEPIITFDYYEPRRATFDRFYRYPVNYRGGGFVSSDYRKRIAIDAWCDYRIFFENNRSSNSFGFGPRFRVNDHLLLTFETSLDNRIDEIGYADEFDDEVVFGRRNVETISNILTATHKFNNKMSVSFRTRHYWSKAKYLEYYLLGPEGVLTHLDYEEDKNRNFNAFNIDLVYFWQFAPGSELNIVYKQALLSDGAALPVDYFDNLRNGIYQSPANMVTVKVLYYIDYITMKKALSRSTN